MNKVPCILSLSLLLGILTFSCSSVPKVTMIEDAETWTMDNGIVSVRISKVTSDLVSFRYNGEEMFATTLSPDFIPESQGNEPFDNPNWKNPEIKGRGHGYWSHDVVGITGSAPAKPCVTINPAKNRGKMAEVAIKAISKGRKMGTGPGEDPMAGNLEVDIEIRYMLEKNSSGVYTYCIFTHPSDYGQGIFGEARHLVKLASFFDWISIDSEVNFHYPKEHNAGDKYIYTANQSENRAFGWSSTTKKVGLFFINPSMEYMSGGPTKFELLGHRDTNIEAAPCVLNYWRSSHYGGAEANMDDGEEWSKIIGPVFIYANSGSDPQSIYDDAKSRAKTEIAKWPYRWVNGVDYPKLEDRATVKGQLEMNDPITPAQFKNLNVGLTAGEYLSPRPVNANMINWQKDAKYYQFWTKGNDDGTFEIAKVRPGEYTLCAFADGVLGELWQTGVTVENGKNIDLGKLVWTPVRKGRQLWDIGIPNRSSTEFFMANERRNPEISLKYAELFPDDITFIIGESDFSKDWFYQHVPHNTNPDVKPAPYTGVRDVGKATPYTVIFNLPSKPEGKAILRFAICGTAAGRIEIAVNGNSAGELNKLPPADGVITRHGLQGIWYEREIEFDAALMQEGSNSITVTIPEGPVNNGTVYDYIRLELDENAVML